jgi:hypothetical protein
MIRYIHYANTLFIFIALILSLIVLVYSYSNEYEINTWQFPVLIAVFLDTIFIAPIV